MPLRGVYFMPGLVYGLIDILEKQIANIDELTVLSNEKRDLIIKNDTVGLSELTNNENAIVNKIQKLDKARLSVMKDIANVLGQDPSIITVTVLAEVLKNQPEHEQLSSLAVSMQEKLDNLRFINDQNKILIDSSLEYINFTVNVIRGSLMPEQAIYDRSGEELGLRQSFFDAKQ